MDGDANGGDDDDDEDDDVDDEGELDVAACCCSSSVPASESTSIAPCNPQRKWALARRASRAS